MVSGETGKITPSGPGGKPDAISNKTTIFFGGNDYFPGTALKIIPIWFRL